jgi:hypothetical protein
VNNSVEGILNVLDAEPVKNLFSPLTREIGGTLGDFGSIVRFYSHRNLEAIFTKWAESRRTPIGSKDFEKALPLLPLAAGVTDEELQDRWAALLESAVTTKKGFLPSFGRTLSELTPEEAHFLGRLRKAASVRCRFAPDGIDITPRVISYAELLKIFDSTIDPGGDRPEWDILGLKVTERVPGTAEKKAQAMLVIQDFERLGILAQHHLLDVEATSPLAGAASTPREPRPTLRSSFALTPYGLRFIIAVTPLSVWKASASDASIPTSEEILKANRLYLASKGIRTPKL